MKDVGVGIVGCGKISAIYFENLCRVFKGVDVRACSDLDPDRAAAAAAEYDGVQAMSTEDLLASDHIEIVVNLTTPKGHFPVAMQAVEAGKHVINEKPLVLSRDEADRLLRAAGQKGVRVGCAPDTFLGAGIQTSRKAIDDGLIGTPVGAQAFMLSRGHESWHPDPEFYYKAGGGPMLDMGPYYLTALVCLLGPVTRVAGRARITFPERVITSEKKYGQKIKVEVPTHVVGIMDFADGVLGTIATSFDVCGSEVPPIEIFGSEGTLSVPDPNGFGGPVRIRRQGVKEWEEIPLSCGYPERGRGLGCADMAAAVRLDRPHRAAGSMARHVLDVMLAFEDASDAERVVDIGSTCERPEPMPPGRLDGAVD